MIILLTDCQKQSNKEIKMKKEKIYAQHGDVLLVKVAEIPNDAKKLKIKNGFIVEKGEGVHTHILKDVKGIEVYEKDGVLYLKVESPTELDHEEHHVKVLEPGIYRKEIENEFDYEDMEARKTRD